MAALFSATSPAHHKTPLRFSSHLNFSFHNLQFKPIPRFSKLVTSLFTGIMEEIGHIEQVGPISDDGDSGFEMLISADTVLGGTGLGDRIAINGTCLTITEIDSAGSRFSVGLSLD